MWLSDDVSGSVAGRRVLRGGGVPLTGGGRCHGEVGGSAGGGGEGPRVRVVVGGGGRARGDGGCAVGCGT